MKWIVFGVLLVGAFVLLHLLTENNGYDEMDYELKDDEVVEIWEEYV